MTQKPPKTGQPTLLLYPIYPILGSVLKSAISSRREHTPQNPSSPTTLPTTHPKQTQHHHKHTKLRNRNAHNPLNNTITDQHHLTPPFRNTPVPSIGYPRHPPFIPPHNNSQRTHHNTARKLHRTRLRHPQRAPPVHLPHARYPRHINAPYTREGSGGGDPSQTGVSMTRVTGPSFWRRTCMVAP